MKLKHLGRAFAVGAITLMLLGEVIAADDGARHRAGSRAGNCAADCPPSRPRDVPSSSESSSTPKASPCRTSSFSSSGRSRWPPAAAAAPGTRRPRSPSAQSPTRTESFAHETLEPASYIVIGGSQEVGWIYWPITAEKDKTLDMGEIKLTKV